MWKDGKIVINGTVYRYEMKVYELPSAFGINGGRISKLRIERGHEIVYNYDRGVDIPPVDEEVQTALTTLLVKEN